MKTDINKQDKILSTIGLKRLMVWNPNIVSAYKTQFKKYVTLEYEQSKRKETDEVYRMSEFNLLHIRSGLRLTLTSYESYDGDTVEYKVIRMFIIMANSEELEVLDANFKDEIFYTSDLEVPFSQTDKAIEIEIKDYFALNYPKVEEKEIENVENGKNCIEPNQERQYIPIPPPTKEEIEEARTEGLERAWIELTMGMRKPQNESEERLLKQIKKGLSEGAIFDIPLE